MIKKLIQIKLRFLAKLFLWRFHPKIVAITGSVGKTSAKEAISTVLRSKFKVGKSQGNYNNEIGLPLAILNEESAGRSLFGWIAIFIKSFIRLFSNHYPEVLVVELGADRPGDIAYLTNLLGNIDTAVITDIGISHLEFFANQAELAKEKLTIIKKLKPQATAVLNFDSPRVHEGRVQTKASVIGFGFDESAQLVVSDFHLIKLDAAWGSNFKIHHQGTVVPFFLPNSLGKPAIYAALAAVGVGLSFGLNLVESSEALKSYQAPAGRLRLIAGIKHTSIIDDSYNSAPASAIAGLDVLAQIGAGRKVAALGDMAELGTKKDSGHREVAMKIIETKVDLVFLVGEETKIIKDELEKRKYQKRIFWYPTSDSARIPLQDALIEGDTILIKGSQSARMEKLVKEIMAEPLRAEELLVRQIGKWSDRP